MPTEVHGHEVLHTILDSPTPVTRESLAAAMAAEYGDDVQYHTCSSSGMDLPELLEFLLMRGKISETDDGLVAHREEMCDHS